MITEVPVDQIIMWYNMVIVGIIVNFQGSFQESNGFRSDMECIHDCEML